MPILSVKPVETVTIAVDPRRPTLRLNPPPREVRLKATIGTWDVDYTGAAPTQAEVDAWVLQRQQEDTRADGFNNAIRNFTFAGQTLQSLKQMTNAEFDAWWDANIDTLAKALAVLKLLTRAAIRRLL